MLSAGGCVDRLECELDGNEAAAPEVVANTLVVRDPCPRLV